MLSTKYLMQSCKDVPDTWIFEYYCKLDEKLTGQDIKFTSVFNPTEKTPSMCIFYSQSKQKYMFKDFSTGKGGSAMMLVQELFKESYPQAHNRVLEDYNTYILNSNGTEHKIMDFKVRSRFKVTSHVVRQWNMRDRSFWTQFNISSKLLDEYNIRALECYKMEKEEDGELKSLEIRGTHLYGYFKKDGTLYKIYQPTVKTHKFIKIRDYLQGLEQLTRKDYLIICSSLKDGMAIKSLGVNCDILVPDSENTMIKPEIIEQVTEKYRKVITLFDNDEAGIKAMKNYKETYGLDFVYFHIEKDVADAVKVHGSELVKTCLIPLINKKIN